MNPGNGIETLLFSLNSQEIASPFNLMNPGNGIETINEDLDETTEVYFQLNESRQRDWNLQDAIALDAPAIFQLNESRQRDWNNSIQVV